MTIPIALFMGLWMNNIRPGKVAESTAIGIGLLVLALVGGQWVSQSATWGPAFTWSGTSLSWAVMVYGFIASVLPVWLLLAPSPSPVARCPASTRWFRAARRRRW